MKEPLIILLAYIIDLIIGDPRFLTHPVVYMGKYIEWLESRVRRIFKKDLHLKIVGIIFPVSLVTLSFIAVWALLKMAFYIHPLLAFLLEAWLISTTIAVKGLGQVGLIIYQLLKNGQLEEARKELAMIVGRDTDSLDETEVSRGVIETVSENIVDAITSPLFYAILGGAPLAMAYRAVNTLDSMVGYKNDKYINLGWASARLDDLANYLPARLTGIFTVIACYCLKLNAKEAFKAWQRDASKHPSPNSGISEATVAGAIGIELGGTNYYKGVVSHRAKMGNPVRRICVEDILVSIKLMKLVPIFFILAYAGITLINL